MALYRQQHGMVLVVSLLLLVVVTILAVSSVKMGMVNLRIVDNMQSKQTASDIAQTVNNEILSDIDNFNSPAAETHTVAGETVSVSAPECIATRPAEGFSAKWGLAPEDTTWEYTVVLANGDNAATATVEQGVEIRMATGSCP